MSQPEQARQIGEIVAGIVEQALIALLSRLELVIEDDEDDTTAVLWINPEVFPTFQTMSCRTYGAAMHLAMHIADHGPVRVGSVRETLGLEPRQHGINVRRYPSLFVIDSGWVDLNDYAFVIEQSEVSHGAGSEDF